MNRATNAILASIVLAGTLAALAVADEPKGHLAGYATVVDGDTLRVGSVRVRLFGIDAPEKDQRCTRPARTCRPFISEEYACGDAATEAMRDMLARDAQVTCEVKDHDRYGRTVAICSNREGDLGGRMVRAGWAIDYERYSHGMYAYHQGVAQRERAGMWAGTFTAPWDYRHGKAGR